MKKKMPSLSEKLDNPARVIITDKPSGNMRSGIGSTPKEAYRNAVKALPRIISDKSGGGA